MLISPKTIKTNMFIMYINYGYYHDIQTEILIRYQENRKKEEKSM